MLHHDVSEERFPSAESNSTDQNIVKLWYTEHTVTLNMLHKALLMCPFYCHE